MNIVLLSGGSGKRLWPLSNDIRSKQFIKIFKKEDGTYESMVQRVYRQIKKADRNSSVTIATAKTQVSAIYNQLGEDVGISIEPCRRDTFPAIALATAYLTDVLHIIVILHPVGLHPKAVHRRPFAPVQHPALQKAGICPFSHFTAQSVNFPYQMSLCRAANRRITGHIGNLIQGNGKQYSTAAQPCRGKCCFYTSVSGADNRDFIFSHMIHDRTILFCNNRCFGRYVHFHAAICRNRLLKKPPKRRLFHQFSKKRTSF